MKSKELTGLPAIASSSVTDLSLLKYSVIVIEPFSKLFNIIFRWTFLAPVLDPNCCSKLVHNSWEVFEFTTRLRISTLMEDINQLNNILSYFFYTANARFSCGATFVFSDILETSLEFPKEFERNRYGQVLELSRRFSSSLARTKERIWNFQIV